jgi:hypothetical protein
MNLSHFVYSQVVLLGVHSLGARADFFGSEVEPNNSVLAPHALGPIGADGGAVIFGSIEPGDVDFFQLHYPDIPGGVAIFASLLDGTPTIDDSAMIFALLDGDGVIIQSYESAGGSSLFIPAVAPVGGPYYFVVTGGGDSSFLGLHQESFSYSLFIDNAPAPPAFALLALGLGRSRRRS